MKVKINEDRAVDIIVYILLSLIGLITLYPFYYTILCSFNDGLDLMKGGIYFWPRKFTLSNYELFIGDADWRHAFLISVSRTLAGTILCTGFTSMFSYALSRNNLMFKKAYRFLVVFTMYFSGGLIPYYVLLRGLGLLNTFWVYVIPGMVNGFFVMTGINFFSAIPESMIEAAKIDGAGEIQIFFRIVMPLAKPALATVGLFIAFMYWNDWYLSMLYVDSANLSSLQYYMYRLMNNITFLSQSMVSANVDLTQMPGETTRMALCVLAAGPMLIVFPFFQKYFVRGISVGAVKG